MRRFAVLPVARIGRKIAAVVGLVEAVMGEATLVENLMTKRWTRRAHVMRIGGRVPVETWVDALVPTDGLELLSRFERHEPEMDVWHLHLVWNARECVRCQAPGMPAVVAVWWMGNSVYEAGRPASVREALDMAATLLWLREKRKPVGAWMVRLPRGATETVRLEELDVTIPLRAGTWVQPGYVVVA